MDKKTWIEQSNGHEQRKQRRIPAPDCVPILGAAAIERQRTIIVVLVFGEAVEPGLTGTS